MILIDVLSRLVEIDTDLLLAVNGWRAEWADYFMFVFSWKMDLGTDVCIYILCYCA